MVEHGIGNMEEEGALVSVIVPVYNTAAYVEATVRSVMNQTLRNIEIVAINDGSTDESPEILERLAVEDSRIKVIHQKNMGLSVGRNVGMEHSSAPYIYFMDSDDLLLPDTLERCYNRCMEQELDFLIFDAEPFSDDSNLVMPMKYDRSHCLTEGVVYSGPDAIEKQLIEQCFTPSACLYIVKRSFIRRYDMHFYKGIVHEDELFTPLLYLHSTRMGYIREKFFRRRFRSNSIMTSNISWRNIDGYLTVAAQLEASRKEMDGRNNTIIDRFMRKMMNSVMWKAYTLRLGERLKLMLICISKGYVRYISIHSLAIMMFKKYK